MLGLLHACGSKPNPEKEEAYQKAASCLAADESFYPIIDEALYYFQNQTLDSITPIYINEQEAVQKLMKLDWKLGWRSPRVTSPPRRERTCRTAGICPGPSPSPTTDWPSSSTTPILTPASP